MSKSLISVNWEQSHCPLAVFRDDMRSVIDLIGFLPSFYSSRERVMPPPLRHNVTSERFKTVGGWVGWGACIGGAMFRREWVWGVGRLCVCVSLAFYSAQPTPRLENPLAKSSPIQISHGSTLSSKMWLDHRLITPIWETECQFWTLFLKKNPNVQLPSSWASRSSCDISHLSLPASPEETNACDEWGSWWFEHHTSCQNEHSLA